MAGRGGWIVKQQEKWQGEMEKMERKVALFGTIFMDLKGFASRAYDPRGRNVGDIKLIHGGVGRNVAENLGILGAPVVFASTVDGNGSGAEITARLERSGVDTHYLRKTPQDGMGMWLAILDEKGDLAGSISKAPDFSLFEALVDECGERIVGDAFYVALEIDLTEAITRKVLAIAKAQGKPVFGIPGNFSVVLAHPDVLDDLECFICNDIEAGKLFGVSLYANPAEQLKPEVERFVRARSLRSMIVTMGEKGVVYYAKGMERAVYQRVTPVEMVDCTGAGDAFFSGVLAGVARGQSLAQAIRLGMAVAAYTICSEENTCVGFCGAGTL